MARIRTIKPSFFTSLTIAELPVSTRLTFVGLWTHVDDSGRCIYEPRLIRAALWPLDDYTVADVEADVRRLTEASLIAHYTVGDRSYIEICGWAEHQHINRPRPSILPGPDHATAEPVTWANTESLSDHGTVSEPSVKPHVRKGKEGKGREVPTTSGADAPTGPGAIVAAWVEAMTTNGVTPTGGMRGQVGKLAKELLSSGNDPDRVLEAARSAGAKGYATIDRELGALNGRARPLRAVEGDRLPAIWRGVE